MTLTDPASSSFVASRNNALDVRDPDRTLRLEVVFEGTSLQRGLSVLGLEAGSDLPAFDSRVLGVEARYRSHLTDRIVELVAEAYAPFGIEVTGDDTAVIDANVEVVSRIILTQVDGGPRRCACHGATGGLGLTYGQTAEGFVLANAFRENGLARAVAARPIEDRIEMLAVALSNTIVHEAGHTFGLVHLDVPGPPTLFMARGGAGQTTISLADMTRVQTFSSEPIPVTQDALSVRQTQCDTCVLIETIERHRFGSLQSNQR